MAIRRQSPLTLKVQEDVRRLITMLRFFRRHLTPARLANLALVEAELRLRRSRLSGLPYFLKVDPTNVCNLRCPLCPQLTGFCQHKSPVPPVPGTLPFDLFRKVADELGRTLFCVLLYGMGEPFLSGEIFRIIRYAADRNIGTMISSNFNIARPTLAAEIVESGLEYLEISLDGADQEAYEKYRVGGRFELVRDNIARLIGERRRRRSRTPLVEWKFIVMRHNEHQIDAARTMARELGVDYLTVTPVSNIDPSRKELLDEWVATNPRYRQYDADAGTDVRTMHPSAVCSWLYRSAVVNADGSVSPCCYFPNFPESRFGDLRSQTFGEIWNGPAYVNARRLYRPSAAKEIGKGAGCCYLCRRSEFS